MSVGEASRRVKLVAGIQGVSALIFFFATLGFSLPLAVAVAFVSMGSAMTLWAGGGRWPWRVCVCLLPLYLASVAIDIWRISDRDEAFIVIVLGPLSVVGVIVLAALLWGVRKQAALDSPE